MNQDPLDMLRSAKSVRLSEDEKGSLRNAVARYATEHPVPQGRQTGWLAIFHRTYATAFASAVLFVAAVSWVAAGSLPGDFLYPVKVNVNEEVAGFMALTPEAKVEWETERATNRLKEAEILSVQGKMDDSKREVIEQNFKKHTKEVQKQLTEMEDGKNFESQASAASNFESSLKAHGQILRSLAEDKDGDKDKAQDNSLLATVKDAGASAAAVREKAEDRVSNSGSENGSGVSAEGKKKAASSKIREVEQFLRKYGAPSSTPPSQAKTRFEDAKSLLEQGNAKQDAGLYKESFPLFQQALRVAQEAKVLAEAEKAMKKEVKDRNEDSETGIKGMSTSVPDSIIKKEKPNNQKPIFRRGNTKESDRGSNRN